MRAAGSSAVRPGKRPAARPSLARPRLGFVGVGWIGRHRLAAVAQSGVAEIAGVADPAAERLGEARELAPEAVLASSYAELLALPLDGMVIATPNALHAEHAIAALERGMAVFCQKPLGRNAAETVRVVDAARSCNRLLGVDLSYRQTAAMQRIHALIHEGALGDIYAVELVFHNAYGPDKPWFYERALAGGGCVLDLGIHLVDLALWALEAPYARVIASRLHAQGQPLSARELDSAVEDHAEVQLELPSGASVRLGCSWRLMAGQDAVIEASFYGTRGGASMRNVDGSFYDFRAELYRGTARELLVAPPDAWGGRSVVAWAEALGRDRNFDERAEHLVTVATVLDAIYQRAGERSRV